MNQKVAIKLLYISVPFLILGLLAWISYTLITTRYINTHQLYNKKHTQVYAEEVSFNPIETFPTYANPSQNQTSQIVFTFDDGLEGIYDARYLFQEYKMPATIYVITEKVGQSGYLSWAQINDLHQNYGFEIGSHSVSHEKLSKMDEYRLKNELLWSKQDIARYTFTTPVSFASPHGDYSPTVITTLKNYYQNQRGLENYRADQTWFFDTDDKYRLYGIAVYGDTPPDEIKNWIISAIKSKNNIILCYHNVSKKFPNTWSTRISDLKEIIKFAAQLEKEGLINITTVHNL